MESQKPYPSCARRAEGDRPLADYRLHDAADYTTWYKTPHVDPTGLAEAVYGLPELHRKTIRRPRSSPRRLLSVGAILATAPLLKGGRRGSRAS